MKILVSLWALAMAPMALAFDFSSIKIVDENPKFTYTIGTVSSALEGSINTCACIRMSVQTRLLTGELVTQDFIFTTEALFKAFYRTTPTPVHPLETTRLFNVGAIEMLAKRQRIGIGFTGVTFGEDRDLGYSDILRTGLYALFNIFRNEAIRLDLRTGYDFERFRVNLGATQINDSIPLQAKLYWNSNNWNGTITAGVGLSPKFATTVGSNTPTPQNIVQISIQKWFQLFSSPTYLGLGAAVEHRHDPLRELLGLNPNIDIASLYISMQYENYKSPRQVGAPIQ